MNKKNAERKKDKKNVHRQDGDKELQKNISEFSYGLDWLQKAYDMIHHDLIMNYVRRCGVTSNIIGFMEMTMEKWNVDLVTGNEKPGNVSNRRGPF